MHYIFNRRLCLLSSKSFKAHLAASRSCEAFGANPWQFADDKQLCRSQMELVGGIPIPLKNDGVKVSWDDDIPN